MRPSQHWQCVQKVVPNGLRSLTAMCTRATAPPQFLPTIPTFLPAACTARKQLSDLDIELEDDTGDQPYLDALDSALHRVFDDFVPDLVIYLSGADPYVDDRLGRLALSIEGLSARDARVLARCREGKVPVAIAMAGGYARQIDDTVTIHVATVLTAARLFSGRGTDHA